MGKCKTPSLSSPSFDDADDDPDAIIDIWCDWLDSLGYFEEEAQARMFKAMRKSNPDYADELESGTYFEILNERLGVGRAAYMKQKLFRPIQRNHRKK